MLDMLYVDSKLRYLIPEFREEKMRAWLSSFEEGEEFRIRSHEGETRFVVQKEDGKYHIRMSLGINHAVNDRGNCSDADAANEGFGRGFAGLGGNSYPKY